MIKKFSDPSFDTACGTDVTYGFYGRTGGISDGMYASLNAAPGSNDASENVTRNRKIIADHLGARDGEVSTVYQCHSADCLFVADHVATCDARPRADALVTDKTGLAIGVLTADCGPVLFVAQKSNGEPIVAATHAGWGGALGGVLDATVQTMLDHGAQLETIKACLGPCIAQASYEVGEDFIRPFVIKHEEAEDFFKSAQKPGHYMFDLSGYIAMRLALCGVRQVTLMGIDTYKNEDDFFSYRRSTHRGDPDYGRQMSCIMIKE
jgi:YfiH family protein